ncbi:MAG: ankyrin repeat domain-containing protein [Bacteroidota bacterium]
MIIKKKIFILLILLNPIIFIAQESSSLDSVLFEYVHDQKIQELEKLLESGIDINIKNHLNETLLMVACKGYDANIDIVRLLVNYGADVFYHDKIVERSALSFSIKYLNHPIVELLLSSTSKNQKVVAFKDIGYLFVCLFVGDERTFESLLPFYSERLTETYLNYSLLESTILLECRLKELFSTSFITKGRQRLNPDAALIIFELLIENGVNVNEINADGIPTVFHSDCSSRLLKKFVTNGVDVNALDNSHGDSITILYSFIEEISSSNVNIGSEPVFLKEKNELEEDLEVLDLLIKNGAKLRNGYNNPFEYALVRAVQNKNINLLKILIHKGHNINFFDLEGKSLLIHAMENNFSEIIDLLYKKGAH